MLSWTFYHKYIVSFKLLCKTYQLIYFLGFAPQSVKWAIEIIVKIHQTISVGMLQTNLNGKVSASVGPSVVYWWLYFIWQAIQVNQCWLFQQNNLSWSDKNSNNRLYQSVTDLSIAFTALGIKRKNMSLLRMCPSFRQFHALSTSSSIYLIIYTITTISIANHSPTQWPKRKGFLCYLCHFNLTYLIRQ